MLNDIRKMSNVCLYKKYKGTRGDIASEMCRRAGTIQYLLKYATFDEDKYKSCMRDTVEIFKNILLKEDRKWKTG